MFILVYITCGSREEAEKIAELLVENKLVACVNFFPVSSLYRWEGKVEKESEFVLLCKTTESKFKEVKEKVKEIHSYDTPAILSVEIRDGDEEYMNWVLSETGTLRE